MNAKKKFTATINGVLSLAEGCGDPYMRAAISVLGRSRTAADTLSANFRPFQDMSLHTPDAVFERRPTVGRAIVRPA